MTAAILPRSIQKYCGRILPEYTDVFIPGACRLAHVINSLFTNIVSRKNKPEFQARSA